MVGPTTPDQCGQNTVPLCVRYSLSSSITILLVKGVKKKASEREGESEIEGWMERG